MRSLSARLRAWLLPHEAALNGRTWPLRILRWGISLGVLSFIYLRLREEDPRLWAELLQLGAGAWGWVGLAALLIPVNLGLEAAKWQVLLRPYYRDLRFTQALQAVLAGLSTGIFTPNRIGEYAGRIWYLPPGHRTEAVALTLLNRLCQMWVTLLAGGLACWYVFRLDAGLWQRNFSLSPALQSFLWQGMLVLSLLWLALMLVFRYLPWRRWPLAWGGALIRRAWLAWGSQPPRRLLIVLGFGSLRYLVFSLQYVFLMLAFGFEDAFPLALAMAGLIFLLKSIVPSIALTELGIRESVAIAVMGALGFSALLAFSSTFVLYVFNLLLPSLAGLLLLGRLKI